MKPTLRLQFAVDALRVGGVIACPTEAVWGLSCDPFSARAVNRLLSLKDRPVEKGLILVAGDIDQLAFLLQGLEPGQRRKLELSWPGATSWLLPHHGLVPPWVSGEHSTVAVRVTAHPIMAALCRAWGGPLVSTSANPGGSRAATELFQVVRYFGDALDGIVPGATGGAKRPSVIRDLASDRVIRA